AEWTAARPAPRVAIGGGDPHGVASWRGRRGGGGAATVRRRGARRQAAVFLAAQRRAGSDYLLAPHLTPATDGFPALLGRREHAAVSLWIWPDLRRGGVCQPDPELHVSRGGRHGRSEGRTP